MKYYKDKIDFRKIIEKANEKQRKTIYKHCKKKGISTDEFTREALDYYHKKYKKHHKCVFLHNKFNISVIKQV